MALAIPIPDKLVSVISEKIAPILKTEAEKISSVPKLINGIKNEMEIAKIFLKKAEKKVEGADDRVKKKVTELREIVFKIEDILDDYELLQQEISNNKNNDDDDDSGCLMGIWGFLQGGSRSMGNFRGDYGIACRIIRINKTMEEMKGNGKGYEESIFSLEQEESESDTEVSEGEKKKKLQDPGFYPLYKNEAELVGFKGRKEEVIKRLDLKMQKYGKGQVVIAVWGEPGVGKTTVVRKVYEDEGVREYFSMCAWITGSGPYKRVDLLKCLFKQFIKSAAVSGNDNGDCVSVQDVEKLPDNEVLITDQLRSYLKQQKPSQNRYLVVLDDIYEMEELSKIMKAALALSHSEGSRILITTKSEGIANYWKSSSTYGDTYYLPALSKEEAKVLFNRKAFGKQGDCPWKLANLRDTIVKECDGLPFLIEKVGAVFSTTQKWIELYHDFQVNPLSPRSRRVFLSSYHEMPYHLKSCFLYLCMFPKGHKLDRMRIARLWIAEGFVTSQRHSTPEEAAEEYLNELVERGMVHLLEKDETGRNREFQLPNMWHHIMLPKLEDLSFCQVLPHPMISNVNSECRRLSIHDDVSDTAIPNSVRSILSFVCPERFPISWAVPYQKAGFRLKVLDLQNAKFESIPKAVGYLHNLRYLCLRNTKVKKLPESISGLWNLQTLDLKQSDVKELPREIKCLHKLRHLLACRYENNIKAVPVKIPDSALGSLMELQKLAFVDGTSAPLVNGLRKLTQLRRLAIVELKESQGESLCKALESMKELRSLTISTISNDEALDLNHIKSPPEYLERLYLEGPLKGKELPTWVEKLNHLVRLRLRYSGFTKDPLSKLKAMLQELVMLELDTYDGQELDFGNMGFRKLEVLNLRKLHSLERIKAGKRALPQLQKAEYEDCPRLKDIPIPPQIKEVLKSR